MLKGSLDRIQGSILYTEYSCFMRCFMTCRALSYVYMYVLCTHKYAILNFDMRIFVYPT